jgi:hypothetical protein
LTSPLKRPVVPLSTSIALIHRDWQHRVARRLVACASAPASKLEPSAAWRCGGQQQSSCGRT